MQVTADILGMRSRWWASDQACALGAGMLAAAAGGVYATVTAAQKKMGSGFDRTFTPNKKRADRYNALYGRYQRLAMTLEPMLRSL